MDATIALVGLAVGIFVGISGVGGSSLMTPLLVIVLGMKPVMAIGTDLLYSVPTKLLGASVHRRQGTVDGRTVRFLCYGGIPGAIVGLIAVAALKHAVSLTTLNAVLRHAIGIALFISAIAILASLFVKRRDRTPSSEPVWNAATVRRLVACGVIVGFLVSVTSIGSGAVTLPALYMIIPQLGLRRLVGSDVAFAAFLIPVAALGQWSMGNVDLHLVANLLVGSLPGVLIGSKLCARLPEIILRPAVASVLVFAGSRLI
jgi:uncharacterized protein